MCGCSVEFRKFSVVFKFNLLVLTRCDCVLQISLSDTAIMLTREQITDIKNLFKECIKDLIQSKEFIGCVSESVAKSVDEKLGIALEKFSDRLESIEKQNTMLLNKIDSLEQYTRRNNVRVLGLQEKENENITDTVINFCKDKLNLNITPEYIDYVHRTGAPQAARNSNRGILVKFTSHYCKNLLLKNRHKLKGTKLLIMEDLTLCRRELYRKAKDRFGVRNVYTLDGTIYVKKGSNKHKILTLEDFQNITPLVSTNA